MNNYSPILLAEDDQDDIFFMRRAFRDGGLSNPLMVVSSGAEAISYLNGDGIYADRRKYPWPCLMLLDLRIPLIDGFDVLAWLQKRRRPKDLQVAILTASEVESDWLRALRFGADAYWVRPRQFEDLVRIVIDLKERIRDLPEIPVWLLPPAEDARMRKNL